MVRLKNRYLLVNILYPELEEKSGTSKVPDVVAFHQPTTDALTPQVLLKALRAEVSNTFGDYGSGAVADSLAIKYLSPATSTFILRVSRAHYRIAWAALSFMRRVPVKNGKNGKNCTFRVVRVSGTIRKAEEEAIRRAKEIIVNARREIGDQGESTLDNIFGKQADQAGGSPIEDITMVDRSDSEEDEDDTGDDD